MSDSFGDFIAREKERLDRERQNIQALIAELQQKLDAANREYAAIDAYVAVKEGKPPAFRSNGATPPARRGRGRNGTKREQLLQLIANQPNGLGRGGLLEVLGVKGDKKGEMAVSNALTALVKNNAVTRREGKYFAVRAA